jgi:putative ABC transport system ATP-binding protein
MGEMTGTVLLAASSIARRQDDRWLLRGVSLTLAGGQRVAVVGPSGSGKTVLLRALALLDPLHAGRIHWRGRQIAPRLIPAYRARVTYLPQRPVLIEGTVEQNLRAPFELRTHRDKSYDASRIGQWLEQLGRDPSLLRQSHGNLSGGEAQLIALLRVLQLDPDVLLLDEPTASLDPQATAALERLLSAWWNQSAGGRAMLWVTHDTGQARRVADRVGTLVDGRLAFGTSVDPAR